jgi:predicted RNA methylase
VILSLDAFFTPASVADRLVRYVQQSAPSVVLDPAAGDGALLSAASTLWPDSRMVALDCDLRRVRSLRRQTEWDCGRCDFLGLRSRTSSHLLREIYQNVDLVLLNPPYSARGNSGWQSALSGMEVRSGRAMAFVLNALETLRDDGEMVALLPSSTVTSQRDSDAWEVVYKNAQVSIIDWFPRGTFPQGTAVTVGIHLQKSTTGGAASRHVPGARTLPYWEVRLLRGNVPVHEAKQAGLSSNRTADRIPYIHTTDMRDGEVTQFPLTLPIDCFTSQVLGPAVLIPRVGKPLPDKIVFWPGGAAVLSDCVFAIDVDTIEDARKIQAVLRNNFSAIATGYKGSCAPYLTISSLVSLLFGMGISAHWDGPARWTTVSPYWSPSVTT